MFVWICAPSNFLGEPHPCQYASHGATLPLPLAPLANRKALTCASSHQICLSSGK